jgi:hypothetical protein
MIPHAMSRHVGPPAESGPPDPHAVLGVDPGAPPDVVRAAYRRLVRLHHPDRHARDPVARQQAEARLREINAAYAALRPPGGAGSADAPPRRVSVCPRHGADRVGTCPACGRAVCARCRRPGGCLACRPPRGPSALDRLWPWIPLALDLLVARRLGWPAAVAGFSVLVYLAGLGAASFAARRSGGLALGLFFPYVLVAAGLVRLLTPGRRRA